MRALTNTGIVVGVTSALVYDAGYQLPGLITAGMSLTFLLFVVIVNIVKEERP